MELKTKLVLVEDDPDIRHFVELHLKREGFQTHSYDNAESCIRRLPDVRPDLGIIDWMLPGLSGLELCRKIDRSFPVVLLTARSDPRDIVAGFEAGADDYVVKPFDIQVLLARIRALLQRVSRDSETTRPSKMTLGSLCVDLESHSCTRDNEELPLTVMEFRLLVALMESTGKVLTRERLIDLVHGPGVVVIDRAIDQHVYRLRKKLGPEGERLESLRGIGYRINDFNEG